MSYSNSFEGGLNTIRRVLPAATATGQFLVGVMPKDGKITRVRFHGTMAETSLSARVFIRDLTGGNPVTITADMDLDVAFNTVSTAWRGVEAVLENQAARDAKALQAIQATVTAGTSSVGQIGIEVAFEPR